MYSTRFFAIILALFTIAVIAVPPLKFAPSVKGKLPAKAEPESPHDLPATVSDGHHRLRARTFGAIYHPSTDHSSYHYSDSQNKLRAKTSLPKPPSPAKANQRKPPRPVPAAKGKPHLIESKERSRFTPITNGQGVKYKYTIINKPKGFPWHDHPEKVYVKGRWGPSEYKFVGRNHFDDLGYYKPGRFGRRGKLVFVRDPWFFREDLGPKKTWFNKGGKYFQKSSHDKHLDHGLDLNHRRDVDDKGEFGYALEWLNNTKIDDLIVNEKKQDEDLISGLEWFNFNSTAHVPANEEEKDDDIISSIAWYSNNSTANLPVNEEEKDDDFISRLSNDTTATVPANEDEKVEDLISGLALLNDTSNAHLSLNEKEDAILNMTSTAPSHADEEEKDHDFISGIAWLNETSTAYIPSDEKENVIDSKHTDISTYTLPLDESATDEPDESPNYGYSIDKREAKGPGPSRYNEVIDPSFDDNNPPDMIDIKGVLHYNTGQKDNIGQLYKPIPVYGNKASSGSVEGGEAEQETEALVAARAIEERQARRPHNPDYDITAEFFNCDHRHQGRKRIEGHGGIREK